MRHKLAAVAALAATALTTGTAGAAITTWDPATAAFIHGYAVEQGTAVEVGDELLPYTLDLHDWQRLAQCESGGRWHLDSQPYRGGVQFLPSTWRAVGGEGDPAAATIDEQITRARLVLDRQGPRAWPACSRRIGWWN